MTNTSDPIKLPDAPTPEATSPETITLSQNTLYFFAVGVIFFIAGFIVAWVTFSTTSGNLNPEAIRSAASSGAREAIQSEVGALRNEVSALRQQIASGVALAPTATPGPVTINTEGSPAWGPADAKVTIVEFSDFECSFCARFFRDTYAPLKAKYGDQVRFVFKHFPIEQIHPNATRASLAAACANDQEKFWEYHDTLFNNQNALSRDGLIAHAQGVGVADMATFTTCLDSAKHLSTVQADLQEGIGIGVNGTPTFFINGLALVGAQPYNVFEFAIEQALKAANANN